MDTNTDKPRADKPKRPTAAERRARIAPMISPAQLRFSMQQFQIVAAVGNTQAWDDVRKGRLAIYYDGKHAFVTRAEAVRYVRAKEEAARQAEEQRAQRATRGLKGFQPHRQKPANRGIAVTSQRAAGAQARSRKLAAALTAQQKRPPRSERARGVNVIAGPRIVGPQYRTPACGRDGCAVPPWESCPCADLTP